MRGERLSSWAIHFQLAGIPTVIQPSSWLVLLILGVLSFPSTDVIALFGIAFFMISGMLCLLVHEYGHALTCRMCGGGDSVIQIASLGGITMSDRLPPTRLGHLLMVLAGPGASFLLGISAGLVFGICVGDINAGVIYSLISPLTLLVDLPAHYPWLMYHVIVPVLGSVQDGSIPKMVFLGFDILFFVCVWWSIFNLVPILPLDGGQAVRLISNSDRLTSIIGMVISAVLLVVFLNDDNIYMAVLMAYFGYLNWVHWKSCNN